jgi:hypothetical protein
MMALLSMNVDIQASDIIVRSYRTIVRSYRTIS